MQYRLLSNLIAIELQESERLMQTNQKETLLQMLKALADDSRLTLLQLLATGER
jgi:hypothetical protein